MTTATVQEAVKEFSEEARRTARRAVVQGRHAAEDVLDTAELQVRKHPIETLGWTFAAGALFGCMFGYSIRRR
jgi:ElaB/YqjD/DUF883 family membrane-anchored ribosome-binding protein